MKDYAAIRAHVEKKFENFSYFFYEHYIITAIILLPIVGFLAGQIPQIKLETSIKHYLQDNDQTLVEYHKFQNQFGSDNRVIVGVVSDNIFSSETLLKLEKFQRELASEVPHIAQVKGLTNAIFIKSHDDEIEFGITGELLQGNADIKGFKELVTGSPIYTNQYYSHNEKLALISLSIACSSLQSDSLDILSDLMQEKTVTTKEPDEQICSLSNKENKEMNGVLEQIRLKYQQDDFKIYLTGMPVLRKYLATTMNNDIKRFLLLSILVIVVLLYILFGRVSGVVIPLIIVFCSVSSTLGIMVLLGKPFQPPTRIIPSFLIAVGIGASVHILFIFYQFFNNGQSRKDGIAKAFGHSALPVVLTCLTTAAGLASFSTAEVAPIANLGFIAALGIFLSLFYTIILLPVLLAITPLKRGKKPFFIKYAKAVSRIINQIVKISTGYPKSIVLFSLGLLIVSLVGICQLKFSHDPLLRLPEHAPLRKATEIISQHFPGVATLEILIETDQGTSLTSPLIVRQFDKFYTRLFHYSTEGIPVVNVFSIYTLIKEIHKNLLPGEATTVLPEDSQLIAQELLLLESGAPEVIHQLTDAHFQLARVTVQVPWVDAIAYGPLLDGIDALSKDVFQDFAEVSLTGLVPLLSRTITATITSMVRSYLIAFLVISAAMVLLIGHFRLGAISMIPNLLPILLTLGYMGWVGIPLDMYTLLIGSIALGLVVDDTIHFMYNFRRYYTLTSDVPAAVKMTLETSGLAMLITTIVLSCGAFIFMASEMNNLYYFGMLTGITIVTALLADFILAPALMSLYYKHKVKKL